MLSLNYSKVINMELGTITFSKPHNQNDFISYIKQKWTGDWIVSKNAIKKILWYAQQIVKQKGK